MTQQTFRRLINFLFALGALTLFSSVALAQYPIGNSHLSDMKPGSVLFFNKYTSDPGNPQQSDTQINITNTSQNDDADIHLFLVDGSTCSIADSFVGLTKNQTTSFLVSDFDPGVTGYIVAVAVSGGTPTRFNWLIGDEYIRENDGRQANLAAVAIAKRSPGDVTTSGDGTASLIFNDAEYERLPNSVALSNFNSQVTDNTQVNIYIPSPSLIGSEAPSASTIFTIVYDDIENPFSTSIRIVCYTTFQLRNLRVAGGNINTIVPADRNGWIRFNGNGSALLGASIQRGPVFMGGHNLHALTLAPSYTIVVPAF